MNFKPKKKLGNGLISVTYSFSTGLQVNETSKTKTKGRLESKKEENGKWEEQRLEERPPLIRPSLPKNIFSSLHTPPPTFRSRLCTSNSPTPTKNELKKTAAPFWNGLGEDEDCVLEKWYKVECRAFEIDNTTSRRLTYNGTHRSVSSFHFSIVVLSILP